MLFVIDLDTLEIIEGANDKRRVSQREASRGDEAPFEVHFVRAGVRQELAAGTVLTFAAKADLKFDGAAVVLQSGFALTGSGLTAEYAADVDLDTVPLDALLEVDGDDTNDLPFVDLMGEFSWKLGDAKPTTARRFRFRVNNDVYRGDESTPAALPDPAAWMPAPLVLDAEPVNGVTHEGATYPGAIDISGDLTDGVSAVVFGRLPFSGMLNGKPRYELVTATDFTQSIQYGAAVFTLEDEESGSFWTSSAPVASPDLVPAGAWDAITNPHAWKPTGSATGTPVVSSATPLATQIGQHAIVSATDVYVAVSLATWVQINN